MYLAVQAGVLVALFVVVDDTVLVIVLVEVCVTLMVDVVSLVALRCLVDVLPGEVTVIVFVFVLLARSSRSRFVLHAVAFRVVVVDFVDTFVVVNVAVWTTIPTVLVARTTLPSMIIMMVVLCMLEAVEVTVFVVVLVALGAVTVEVTAGCGELAVSIPDIRSGPVRLPM